MAAWFQTRWRIVALAVAAVAVTGLLVTGGVLAQTPPATPPPGAAGAAGPSLWSTFLDKLAARLGIPSDRLKSAVIETEKEMIDEAVASGRLPAEAGKRLKERAEKGQFALPPAKGRGPAKARPVRRPALQALDLAADCLKMEPRALSEALRQGKSLAEVAATRGVSRADLISCLIKGVETRLNKAVADGKLTRERADQTLARFKAGVDKLVDRKLPPGQQRRPGGPPPKQKPGSV